MVSAASTLVFSTLVSLARSVALSPSITQFRAVPVSARSLAVKPQPFSIDKRIAELSRTCTSHQVTVAGAVTNVFLSGLKAGVGGLTGSPSLIADAGHSLSDLLSDALALCAASVPAWESLCTRGIAIMLGCTGGAMVYHAGFGLLALAQGAAVPAAATALDAVSLCVAIVSIVSKEILYRVTHAVGIRCHSSTIVANAHHHRSDAMSSIAAFFGIGGAIAGFRSLDSLAALVVGGMVMRLGLETLSGGHDHDH